MENFFKKINPTSITAYLKRPTYERAFFTGLILLVQSALLLYSVYVLNKPFSDFLEIIPGLFIFDVLILFVRDITSLLALSTLLLFPFNRFLIVEDSHSYLLGRISDYILIGVHLFEIPLYLYALFLIFRSIKDKKNYFRQSLLSLNDVIRMRISRQTYTKLFYLFLALLLITPLLALVNNTFAISFSRIQIFIDLLIFMILLDQLNKRKLVDILLLSTSIQSLLGILQVGMNSSLGLYSLGESKFNNQLFYIAKSIMFGTLRVRAYGTFPHPNILAAFLAIGVILQIHRIGELIKKGVGIEQRVMVFNSAVLALNILALYLTQSRTVIFSLAISGFITGIIKIYRVGGYKFKMLLFSVLLGFSGAVSFIVRERIFSLFSYDNTAISDRMELFGTAFDGLRQNLFFGLGPNGYLDFLAENKAVVTRYTFIIEPVHNVFVLVLSEYGLIIGIGFIIIFLSLIFSRVASFVKSSRILFVMPFAVILLSILMMDHYLLTLKQGSVLLALYLYFIAREKIKTVNEKTGQLSLLE